VIQYYRIDKQSKDLFVEKWAIINDWHIPKHDKRKVALWLKLMKKWKPDHITINGDFDDMEAPSRWTAGTPSEYTERISITTQTEAVKILNQIRADHPNANMDWLDGNHENRIYDYVAKNAPALVDYITIPSIFGLENLGIEYQKYGEPPKKKFGDMYIHHGQKISSNAGESVRKEMDHYGVSMIIGHTHRIGSYNVAYYDGRKLKGYEGGHMTDVSKMDYAPFHNWQSGFLAGYVDGDKCWIDICQFEDNDVIFEGKKYSA
jgi:metallophosphoesterase superfamily enzyme